MAEPKNCKCECHEEKEETVKHPPHTWSMGYTMKYDGKTERVQLCTTLGCKKEKREFIET